MHRTAPHRTVTLAAILPIPSAERVAGRWDGSDGARPTGYCRKKEAGSRRHKSLYGTSLMQSTRAGHVYMSVYRRTVCAQSAQQSLCADRIQGEFVLRDACRLDQSKPRCDASPQIRSNGGGFDRSQRSPVQEETSASRLLSCADTASLHCVL